MTDEIEDIRREFLEWLDDDKNIDDITGRDIQNFLMSKLKYSGSEPSPITNWKELIQNVRNI